MYPRLDFDDREVHASIASHADLCGNGDWRLRRLDGRNLLFVEADQAVYELDTLTACQLPACEIVKPRLRASPELETDATETLPAFSLEIAAVRVQLHLSQDLLSEVDVVLGPLRSDGRCSHAQLCARNAGAAVEILPPGRPPWSVAPAEFIPSLKAELMEIVLRNADYEVALHAAALVRGESALLIAGSPGAGKTMLAMALAHAGLAVAADDVSLLHADGSVSGVGFPFTAKASAWELIDRHWPGLMERQSYVRPDGQSVRYVPLGPATSPGARRIGSVVFLDRQAGAPVKLDDVRPIEALSRLISEGTTRDERLGVGGFDALVGAVGAARCYRLSYSDLHEAAAALRDLDW